GNAGDTHKNGRSVIIAEFSSGFKIVYKPKSLAVDRHFQQLLSWFNERGAQPPFRALQCLDRETYGWVEFVASKPCISETEVTRFYKRQGSYLALLLMLSASDFHHENVVAAGEHPVLVDLEALFHPQIINKSDNSAEEAANETLADSVMGIGLLPQRIWAKEAMAGVDISGLGGAGGQLSPFAVPLWDESGTDQMQLARRQVKMSGSNNLPTLNGSEVDALAYSEAIVSGFTGMYQLLIQQRQELLAEEGPLSWFANDEVRVIVRATRTYAILFRESFHPNVLRDGLDRERLFDRLWAQVTHQPHLAALIAAERADLQQGDIPIFTTCPEAEALWDSHGEIISDFFPLSGLARAKRRLEQFGTADLKKQLWFIQAALGTLAKKPETVLLQPQQRLPHQEKAATPEKLLQAAMALGDELAVRSLAAGDEVTWLGVTLGANDNWLMAPLGLDMYDGLPGITLFLAYLGAVTQQEQFTQLAQKTATTWRRRIENHLDSLSTIGGFSGRGGLIYTLTHLGVLWQRPELLAEAETLATSLPTLIPEDAFFDIIGGAAGCIGALLALYRVAPSTVVLDTAIQCGDYLLAQGRPQRKGIGWQGIASGEQCLSGFSHGAAGIAWALLELAAVSKEVRFQQAALDAIEYERSLFVPEKGNWLDLRKFTQKADEEASFMLAWCHGAPGIGLGRLLTLPMLESDEIRAEIETAVKTTLAYGFGNNHSLCHGDLGNLELLLQAGQYLQKPDIADKVYVLAGQILAQGEKYGWLCGTPMRIESPGLMTGLSGIGYELLRLAKPDLVPSLLTLAPPVVR
ncbi:MAG: type 2 lantipeptide synthetase LanM family protein, partial [Anaerolineales bacterium]|nr:type 2 lantipeptide synthetase LanM family protein [Anaerolineales bacterium]